MEKLENIRKNINKLEDRLNHTWPGGSTYKKLDAKIGRLTREYHQLDFEIKKDKNFRESEAY